MDTLVNRIIEIEKKANSKIDSEKKKMDGLEKEVEKVLLEKRKELEEKQRSRVENLLEMENQDEQAAILKLNEEFEESVAHLTTLMDEHKAEWCDEIFKRIIS